MVTVISHRPTNGLLCAMARGRRLANAIGKRHRCFIFSIILAEMPAGVPGGHNRSHAPVRDSDAADGLDGGGPEYRESGQAFPRSAEFRRTVPRSAAEVRSD